MSFLPAELIKKTRNAVPLSAEEIHFLIRSYTKGQVPDYQISAWLMAVYFRGLNTAETAALTQAIIDSGITMTWPQQLGTAVDKHSTGGVGDKTSLILGPIAAAAGVPVPMISGRGLGHTGGTLDKLESIPGFRVHLSIDEFREAVIDRKLCFLGQTQEMCPADKKLYALRDVTGTVESLPLICSSILSKKISEGIGALVLDVKFGSGAFMKSFEDACALADQLIAAGATQYDKKVGALITSMEQPLGRFSGNALEVIECLHILRGEKFLSPSGVDLYEETRLLSVELAAFMIWLGGRAESLDEGRTRANEVLNSGAALLKFEEVCAAQGGDLSQLSLPPHQVEIRATESGYIESIHTEKVGVANILLGAGRAKAEDSVDPRSGTEVCIKIGDEVKKGDLLFKLYCDRPDALNAAELELDQVINYSLQKVSPPDLIREVRLP